MELFRQLKSANAGTSHGEVFADLLQEIEQDQIALRDLLKELDFRVSPIRKAAAWFAEKFVLKLLAENPGDKLVRLEQMEALALGIQGKRALWLALNAVAAQAPLFESVDLMRLVQRAKEQHECVESIRLDAARDAFLWCASPENVLSCQPQTQGFGNQNRRTSAMRLADYLLCVVFQSPLFALGEHLVSLLEFTLLGVDYCLNETAFVKSCNVPIST